MLRFPGKAHEAEDSVGMGMVCFEPRPGSSKRAREYVVVGPPENASVFAKQCLRNENLRANLTNANSI